jgi:Peptidase A4 family
MRVLRYFLVSGSAAVLAGSLMLATQATVTTAAAPDLSASQPSAHFLAQARAALVSYLSANHPAPPVTSGDPGAKTVNEPTYAPANTSATGSFNWSGYADASKTPGTFTKVSGQWKTPKVHCTREDQLTSNFVGIDGFNSSTVEQDGTYSWCFLGQATYFTWYEMDPAGSVVVGNSVRPGDKITASVTRAGTNYTLALTDSTHPINSFSTKQTCTTCQNTSVEWITERPTFSIGIAPLADYRTWALSSASQTAGGKTGTISGYPTYYKIDMVDATDTYPLSLASGLNNAGNGFLTHWTNSY